MFKTTALLLGTAALLTLGACAQQEEEIVLVPQDTPIYAKDGTVVGYEPNVVIGDDD